ncbi:kinase-like protein [Mollisia scopiformis]|uniref:Kinase-like protein n=1 Tax=Mollisia scopiformis TaxID=149040 RepID=A0A194X5X9_MOLSC|nr:kinase-like protein [Mollisia scopiformis]KUJ15474.1 kinase-like protein [Mollisia scopiformis]
MASFMNDKDVKEALSLIEGAKLPHPSDPLLSSFIIEALDPRLAARYVLRTTQSGENQQVGLLRLVSDWTYLVESISKHGCSPPTPDAVTQANITKRDGGKCCITGKVSRVWDPLVVVPVLPVPSRWIVDEPRIFNMLGAFLTPSYRDWWLAYVERPEDMNSYHNHWLVRRSAAHAFAQGVVTLDRFQPSMIEYEIKHVLIGVLNPIDTDGSYPLLGDHSRLGIEKVDPRFIGTHARFSPSCRWLHIAEQIALSKEPSSRTKYLTKQPAKTSQSDQRSPFSITGLISTACLAVWVRFPDRVRVATYKMLQKIGYRLYGKPNAWESVQRLPFGLYLKYLEDPDRFRNEFNALKMVRQYTSVPVPKPIDLVIVPTKSKDPFYSHDAYLVTSRVPGIPLSRCQAMLSDDDSSKFVSQMQDYLTQIRAIPKIVSPEYAICDTLGGPCRDPRIRDSNPVGPFVDEAAFSQVLRNPDEPSRRGHQVVFTHGDLNARNILVDRDGTRGWKVTGIVDWENSGYYPEYWDYTKSLFEGFRYSHRWCEIMHDIFKQFGDLSKEFEVENRSWEEGDYV